MLKRIFVHGVPVTLRADAYMVLPGDERVEVALDVAHVHGFPLIKMDVTGVIDRIHDRRLDDPS